MIVCIHKLGDDNYKIKVYTGTDIIYYEVSKVDILPPTFITNYHELIVDCELIELNDNRAIILRK